MPSSAFAFRTVNTILALFFLSQDDPNPRATDSEPVKSTMKDTFSIKSQPRIVADHVPQKEQVYLQAPLNAYNYT